MTLAIGGITVVIVLAAWSAGRTRDGARAFAEQDVPAVLAIGAAGQSLIEAASALLNATRVAGDQQAQLLADHAREIAEVHAAFATFRTFTDGDETSVTSPRRLRAPSTRGSRRWRP